ncbi:MAG: ABC transporter ATP-binding protein [Termitinemataceae bacterium]|nr:MAG: ABC transporter ATP-binding protein [Termitinemataceae bacterium]
MSETLFSCISITKCYCGEPVVKDITFDVPYNAFYSLVGRSGIGKTTLFNVLACVDKPDSGSVLLCGKDITGKAGSVSYMLQKDLLLPYMTLLDNAALPLILRGKKKAVAREEAASYFAEFALSGHEKKYPANVSGGQRQRAALLRTCLMNNKIILLDEPFSALDAITRLEMGAWFKTIAAKRNLAAIFVTHDIDEAIRLSNKVFVMSTIAQSGIKAAAYAPALITKVVEIPQSINSVTQSNEYIQIKKTIFDAI